MENSKLPPGYGISYTSHCKDHKPRHGEQGRKCSNISIGDEVCIRVGLLAASVWPLKVMLIIITSLVEHPDCAQGILTSPLGEL